MMTFWYSDSNRQNSISSSSIGKCLHLIVAFTRSRSVPTGKYIESYDRYTISLSLEIRLPVYLHVHVYYYYAVICHLLRLIVGLSPPLETKRLYKPSLVYTIGFGGTFNHSQDVRVQK